MKGAGNMENINLDPVFEPTNELFHGAKRALYLLDAMRETYIGEAINDQFLTDSHKAACYASYHDAIEACVDGIRLLLRDAVAYGEKAIQAIDKLEGKNNVID